ncbi:MAG TPA: GWxTD domain-containing protein [Thermoanaerobaculia bacterium]|nr:GWxTD domain-containing protein [Thermoanaerobaculia bacterium]
MLRKITLIATVVLAVAAMGADDIMKWNKTPESYFMTAEEKAAWKDVKTPSQAQEFVDEFRRKRGPMFRDELRRRVEAADKQFGLGKTPGSQTQRGRVFIVMGGGPSRSTTDRRIQESGGLNRIEAQAIIGSEWTYEADRLPADLGTRQLKIKFVTDTRRAAENIDNPGNVEPQLAKVAELESAKFIAQAAQAQQRTAPAVQPAAPAAPAAPAGSDPLWNATPSLNGAMVTGDAFISPTEQTFYAYNFYVPKSAGAFAANNGVLVTLVRDANGQQVISDRKTVDLSSYDDASGARFVDHAVALPPGKYDGLFAFYAPDGTTLLSSHRASFEVAPKDEPRASALFLTSRIDTLEKQEPLDPFTFVATKYAVRADRRFRTADKLAFFTIVANPTGSPSPNLMQKMTFKKDGKEFAKTPLEPAQVTQTGPNTFLVGNSFDPETFPAGHYSLELQVRDMNAPDDSPLRKQGWVLKSEFDVVK